MPNICHSFDLSILPERHVSGWGIYGVSQLKEQQISEELKKDYTEVKFIARKLYMSLLKKINSTISKQDKVDIYNHYRDTKQEWGKGYSTPVTYNKKDNIEVSDDGVSFYVDFSYADNNYSFEVWLLNKKTQSIIKGLAAYGKEERCVILPILEEENTITRNTIRFIYQHEGLIIHELTHNIDFVDGILDQEKYYNKEWEKIRNLTGEEQLQKIYELQKLEVNKPSEVNALTQQIIWYIHKQILQSKDKYQTLKDFAKTSVSNDFINDVFGVQFCCSINSPDYNEELNAVNGIWLMLNKENQNKIKQTVKDYLFNYISKIKRENINHTQITQFILDEFVFESIFIKE